MFGNQNWRTGIRAIPYPLQSIPNPLYVDADAVASGSGTIDSPLNSITTAFAMAMGREGQVICVKSTETNPFRVELVPFESTIDLEITGWDSEPWHLYGSELITSGWSSIGSGIYTRSLGFSVVNIASVPTMIETVGDAEFVKKLIVAPIATAPEQGQIGYSGGLAYVRLPSDENPNLHQIEIARRNTGFRAWGFANLKIKDLVARNFLNSAVSVGASGNLIGTGKLELRDSLIEFSGLNGVTAAAQNESTTCYNVIARRVTNDGFNHRRISGAGVMTLNGCDGSYNGDFAGQSSQGASAHTDATLIINGGQYNYNVSGGMVSIDTSVNNIYGDTIYGSVRMNGNMRLGNTTGTIANQASCAWMDLATGAVTGQVIVSNGGGVGVRVNTPNAVTGLENITSVGNALPDVIA